MARAKPEVATPTTKPAATKKAAAKKTTTKKTTAKPATDGDRKTRRPGGDRGWLAREIDKVLRKATGPMTVREIAAKIKNSRGESPSSGAVAAALLRWSDQGYVTLTGQRPQAFKGFTKKYATSNLDAFLGDERDKRIKARAATKAKAA
jgi:hypothetical protein